MPDPELWHPPELNPRDAVVEPATNFSQELFSIDPQKLLIPDVFPDVYVPEVFPQYPFKSQIKGAFTHSSAAGVDAQAIGFGNGEDGLFAIPGPLSNLKLKPFDVVELLDLK